MLNMSNMASKLFLYFLKHLSTDQSYNLIKPKNLSLSTDELLGSKQSFKGLLNSSPKQRFPWIIFLSSVACLLAILRIMLGKKKDSLSRSGLYDGPPDKDFDKDFDIHPNKSPDKIFRPKYDPKAKQPKEEGISDDEELIGRIKK